MWGLPKTCVYAVMVTKKLFRGDYLLVGVTHAGELCPHDLSLSQAAPLR